MSGGFSSSGYLGKINQCSPQAGSFSVSIFDIDGGIFDVFHREILKVMINEQFLVSILTHFRKKFS